MEGESIQWEAFEYEPRRRTQDWYWAVGIVTVAIAAISIFFGDFLFAMLVVISAITLCFYAAKPPQILSYEVNHKGILIHKRMYPYDTLEAFWVEDDDMRNPKLLIKSKKVFMPFIVIELHEELDKEMLRAYLKKYLKQVHLMEPLSQKVMEYLGF